MRDDSTNRQDRRTFIKATGAAGVIGLSGLAGCSGDGGNGNGNGNDGSTEAPSGVEPADEISFISESTPPSVAVDENIDEFTEETGIEVSVTLAPFNNYSERLASDLNSGAGDIHVFYADPYMVGSRFWDSMEPLQPYIDSDDYADVPNGVDDFITSQVNICGQFGGKLRGLPYDNPTMMWAYRTDIIEDNKDAAESDLGFPFEPGPERTWEEYLQMAEWINENVDEVAYGTGHQAQQHDSLQCDFHNVFWAHGGEDVEGFGGHIEDEWPDDPQPSFASDTGVAAAEFYKELLDVAHPGSTSWTWSGVGDAFANGEIAMTPEWHEFNASFASSDSSEVAENVGWTLLPQADNRSVNLFGGSGIAMNAHASDAEKAAAWEFITWATSPENQMRTLEQGGTPTRTSIFEREEVKEASEQPSHESQYPNVVPDVQTAWEPDYVGTRPKPAQWPQLNETLYSELSAMIAGNQSPQEAMEAVDSGWSNLL